MIWRLAVKLASIFMYVSLLRLYLYEYQQTAHMPAY